MPRARQPLEKHIQRSDPLTPEGRARQIAAAQTPEARAKRSNSLRRPLVERFEKKAIRGARPDDCWSWHGSKDGHGYGQMRIEKKNKLATHVSLELAGVARDDPALCALHTCDNPECTNPRHLYWGTRKQNTADAKTRGRLDLLGFRLGRGDKGAKEREVQRELIDYLAARGFAAVHIPNGAQLAGTKLQRAKQMAALRRDGLQPGFPDIAVIGKGGRVGFLEVKREIGGTLSPNQVKWRDRLEFLGHKIATVHSIDDAQGALAEWGWT